MNEWMKKKTAYWKQSHFSHCYEIESKWTKKTNKKQLRRMKPNEDGMKEKEKKCVNPNNFLHSQRKKTKQ